MLMFKKNDYSIQSKIRSRTLSLSLISIMIICMVAAIGILLIRLNVKQTSEELGHSAASDSKNALEEQTKTLLETLVQNKAAISDEKFQVVLNDVYKMQQTASEIVSNPNKYTPREIYFPDAANEGKLVMQLRLGDEVEFDDVSEQIALMANMEDTLINVMRTTESIESAYLGTEDGISIAADKTSHIKKNVFEPRSRPWYQTAKEAGKLIWTDVFDDATGRGLAITIAAPYFDNDTTCRGVVGAGMKLTVLNEIVVGTKIGETGYAFLINELGQMIISDSIERDAEGKIIRINLLEDNELKSVAENMIAGKSGIEKLVIDGVEKYIAYAPMTTLPWSIATVMNVEEATASALLTEKKINSLTDDALNSIDNIIVILALIFVVALLSEGLLMSYVSKRIAKSISSPILKLSMGADIISSGNLDYVLNIKTGDEIEMLADTFNSMIINIKTITGEKERIGAELNVATKIQASMLPCIFPAFPERAEFDIYATMLPAKEVGGDFYDFFLIDEDHLAIVMADVSGKGVPAALFMVIAKTLIKNNAQYGKDPKTVFCDVNNLLCENNEAGMFVTAFMGYYEISTGKFTYVNAGHNPPVIKKKGGEYEYLKTKPGFVLAGFDGFMYKQDEIYLDKGDIIYLYTDGVTEATNKQNELFTDPYLIEVANTHKELEIKDFLIAIKKDIDIFADGAEQADDITMLGLKISEN